MAQVCKGLGALHENLTSIPHMHIRSQTCCSVPLVPGLRKHRQEDPCGLLASPSSENVSTRFGERDPVSKNRMESKEDTQS